MLKKSKRHWDVYLSLINSLSIKKELPLSLNRFPVMPTTLMVLNIHCGIVDELYAHKTRDVWEY